MSIVARVGQVVSFLYPASNHDHVALRWERRTMRIDAIDDSPAEQEYIDRDPHLRRLGPRLIGPAFCRSGAVRSFYRDAARRLCVIEDEGTGVAMADDRESEQAEREGRAKGGGVMEAYQVWIVEEVDDRKATLEPAGFSTTDIGEAKAWATGFNDAELEQPVEAWAIVRRVDAPDPAPNLHQNL